MRILLILIFFFFSNCSKPKTVLICGDHVCVNKTEAKQFFEENLSIEVKIMNQKADKKIDLIELNLNDNSSEKREVKVFKKNETNKKLKKLSKEEIENIKKNIKKQKENKKIAKKIIKKNDDTNENKVKKIQKKENRKSFFSKNNVDKRKKEVVDVCTIIKKCNIEEITKYLLNEGRNKEFPDITKR